jgi:hypothetical protein
MSETWVPDSCTLPTRERPLRVAEFDEVLNRGVRTRHRPDPRRLRLTLDAEVERELADLIRRESACCSFFTFTLTQGDGELTLDVEVSPGHEPVLDALTSRLPR